MKSSVRLDQTLQRLWTLPATLSVGAHRQCGCVLGRRELYKIQCAGKSGTADARPWDKSPKEKAKKENATPSPKKSGKSKATGGLSRAKSAEFIKSSTSYTECPPPLLPEIAFIGRSNVGKSSLINALTGRDGLAQVSKKPGKTRMINHFKIDNKWYLVDLPGYGFAQVGKDRRQGFITMVQEYFLNRPSLCMVMLLVDSSVPVQQIDVDCANWFGENQIPFGLVFTKCDKRNKNRDAKGTKRSTMQEFRERLAETWDDLPEMMVASSYTKEGIKGVLNSIAEIREYLGKDIIITNSKSPFLKNAEKSSDAEPVM